MTLPLIAGVLCARNQTHYGPIMSQISESMWIEFGIVLRFVGLMNFMLFLCCPTNTRGRERYLCDFGFCFFFCFVFFFWGGGVVCVWGFFFVCLFCFVLFCFVVCWGGGVRCFVLFCLFCFFNVGLFQTFTDLFSFKFGMMIGPAESNILMPVRMTLAFIQGHGFMRNQNFCVHCIAIFSIDLDEIYCAALTCFFFFFFFLRLGIVDYEREMTSKKSYQYDACWSFEHLLVSVTVCYDFKFRLKWSELRPAVRYSECGVCLIYLGDWNF